MITRFITEVTTKINPFSVKSRSARLFLTVLPPSARSQGMTINTKLLPKTAAEKTSLQVKFKDGKLLDLDCESMGIKGLIEECDRHSRLLQKQAALADA
ncbi:putative ribosomal protein YmL44, mitochondrial [Cryphonectria parasitica EP155]|uniref:Large ribosomal subunit protein mL53 n=1 Tax=Cryphonectria parasitica (strain ATCC 38755 / EP155) TaxID=660469 RepID=A0A9P4Y9M6_CRYP1|nr:putative ribosomal protein YmL44, mitochondrial [Cryphonectria parasitica EP155]KAF3768959.1 putative ribosomal protein YmL44, mitochondrial [Cryphonectria parasitica EP155]